METIWRSVHEEYRRARVECGGLLWGIVREEPRLGVVAVVLQATKGRCRATQTSCELLPESWALGRSELPDGCDWVNVGDYHSHPDFGVFMSADDRTSFWAWGHLPHWVGCVVDPLRGEIGMFVKRSETDYGLARSWWVPDAWLRTRRAEASEVRP